VKQAIESQFGDKVQVHMEATPNVSGFLEVEVVGGPVLHSKKNGQGYVDTPEKEKAIMDKLRAFLEGGAAEASS